MHPRTREIRLRNLAKRRGLEISKSRRRDEGSPWYGLYVLRDRWASRVVGCVQGVGFTLVDAPNWRGGAERWGAWLTLDEVEGVLQRFGQSTLRPTASTREVTT